MRLDHDTSFAAQPDWVGVQDADRARDPALPAELVYLEVWKQPVGAEEDRELAEPALGGPDTTVRLRTMARVRRWSVQQTSCPAAWAEVTSAIEAAGLGNWTPATCALQTDLRLRVDYLTGGVPEDLCAPGAQDGYLGAENQAIRVQLVDKVGPAGNGALVWGFDNGAPIYRARVVDSTTIELDSLPRDEAHWPLLDQAVEVLPWSAVLVPDGDETALSGEVLADSGGRASPTPSPLLSLGAGHLTKLQSSYDPATHRMTLFDGLPAGFNARGAAQTAAGVDVDHDGDDRSALVFVRVWGRGSDLDSPPRITYVTGSGVTLGNTGIQVTVTGDATGADAHWIIAARPNTPDQVYPWSFEDPDGRAPHGVRRFLVPLAVITWAGQTGVVHDCRETFRPLTRTRSCCRYTVGDGEVSHGDFTSIQAAIDNLPPEGGEVCISPGTYPEVVTIEGRADVTVHGCGARSQLAVPAPADAVVIIRDSARIVLRDLAITSDTGWGIHIPEDAETSVEEVELAGLEITVRDRGAVLVELIHRLDMHGCEVRGRPLEADPLPTSVVGRLPLVMVRGSGLVIAGNAVTAEAGSSPVRRVLGGMLIGGGSEDVVIDDNRIVGGNGQGITLGHVTAVSEPGFGGFVCVPYWFWDGNCLRLTWILVGVPGQDAIRLISGGLVERVFIRRNRIENMAGDGVGVPFFFDDLDEDDLPDDIITVRELRVIGNRIIGCNTGERKQVSAFVALWSGHGPIALADVEDGLFMDNEIRDNGVNVPDPICGIFILMGEGVVIERNRISSNGRAGADYVGFLGGIVLPLVAPFRNGQIWDGRAAVRIVGNQVVAREGPALLVRAASGTVEATGNELATSAIVRLSFLGLVADLTNAGIASEDFDTAQGPEGSLTADRGGQIIYSRNVVAWQPPRWQGGSGLWMVRLFTLDDIACTDNVSRADLGPRDVHGHGPLCVRAHAVHHGQPLARNAEDAPTPVVLDHIDGNLQRNQLQRLHSLRRRPRSGERHGLDARNRQPRAVRDGRQKVPGAQAVGEGMEVAGRLSPQQQQRLCPDGRGRQSLKSDGPAPGPVLSDEEFQERLARGLDRGAAAAIETTRRRAGLLGIKKRAVEREIERTRQRLDAGGTGGWKRWPAVSRD